MTRSVIIAGARTPIGKFRGSLAGFAAVDLGAIAIRAALERSGVSPEQVEYVIMGHVIQAGTGQITARQAAVGAGIPKEVPAITINKVCLSGLSAIAMADQMIRAGELEIVVAGGMESMTNAPYLVPKARDGSRMGDAALVDSMIHDGLWSSFHDHHMGEGTDIVSRELGLERVDQDVWSERSHRRAIEAWDAGRLAEEVVPVEVPQRKGDPVVFDRDEGIRPDTSLESLAALTPAFTADGTVTAGNASKISDGAAAVVVASEEAAARLELRPIAFIEAYGMAAGAYSSLQTVPALAIEAALKRAGLDVGDLGLVEINEAFAAVAIHASRMLGIGDDVGAAALCGGGGQGDALIVRRM